MCGDHMKLKKKKKKLSVSETWLLNAAGAQEAEVWDNTTQERVTGGSQAQAGTPQRERAALTAPASD